MKEKKLKKIRPLKHESKEIHTNHFFITEKVNEMIIEITKLQEMIIQIGELKVDARGNVKV